MLLGRICFYKTNRNNFMWQHSSLEMGGSLPPLDFSETTVGSLVLFHYPIACCFSSWWWKSVSQNHIYIAVFLWWECGGRVFKERVKKLFCSPLLHIKSNIMMLFCKKDLNMECAHGVQTHEILLLRKKRRLNHLS